MSSIFPTYSPPRGVTPYTMAGRAANLMTNPSYSAIFLSSLRTLSVDRQIAVSRPEFNDPICSIPTQARYSLRAGQAPV